jgi:5,10-methylenetetrahydromethanopterin reductase
VSDVAFDVGIVAQERVDRVADLATEAEAAGFEGVWVADSQSVFRDPWAALALSAARTSRIRLATGVTNPVTRHPAVLACAAATLDELSGGRAVLGIGVGESSVRTLGLRPASLTRLEEVVAEVRGFLNGGLEWSTAPVPVVVAATGPKALQFAGRSADGVLIQVGADPALLRWALQRVEAGAKERGRPIEEIEVCLRLGFGTDAEALRPYAAAAARTIAQAVPVEELPTEFAADLHELRELYDYARHVSPVAPHRAAVTERILERVAVVGPLEEVEERVRELAALGLDRIVLTAPLAASREVVRQGPPLRS